MKKVLALVLAVAMLATTAFAAVVNPGDNSLNDFKDVLPGGTISINDSGIADTDGVDDNGTAIDYVLASEYPGSTESTVAGGKVIVKSINTDNYTLTGIKYNDGKKLVDSIYIDNADECVKIKLKQDYVKTSTGNLDVEFTLKGKKVGKTFKPENIVVRVQKTVGYKLDKGTLVITSSGDIKAKDSGAVSKTELVPANKLSEMFAKSKAVLWEVKKDAGSNENYGDLDYSTADPDVDVTVRVYDGDELYLYSNVDPDKDILKQFADEEADITFLNHPYTTFNSTATVRIYKEEGETFFYEWVDGKLVDMNGKANSGAAGINKKVNWDDDEGCYILKTREMPKKMIMSDKALPIDAYEAPADTTPNNPDTGANDVVGIATALAAVALVSAAAISLKK